MLSSLFQWNFARKFRKILFFFSFFVNFLLSIPISRAFRLWSVRSKRPFRCVQLTKHPRCYWCFHSGKSIVKNSESFHSESSHSSKGNSLFARMERLFLRYFIFLVKNHHQGFQDDFSSSENSIPIKIGNCKFYYPRVFSESLRAKIHSSISR